ncbi:MAG: class I SAM-dependent methyltransferase [Candidatus Doudnabacteria bacterium]|nr:class I SAM-dependent methyltransferase [Candidatus Doudnabacteria bacterium]
MSIKGKIAKFLNKREIQIDQKLVDSLVEKEGVHSWFSYIVKERPNRWDVWESSFWLASRLAASDPILETGCGIASNLIWFAQQGFTELYGTDIDDKLLSIAKQLNNSTGSNIHLWHEDGLKPKEFPRSDYKAIISLNWTFLVESFDLTKFLETYSTHLAKGGFMLIDIIDKAYDQVENNQYLTSDLHKPEKERAVSEYKKRYSESDVKTAAGVAGFEVVSILGKKYNEKIPKYVYIFQKK